SILGRAQDKGLIQILARDIRAHAEGKHKVTDDAPYGGGAGMVMKVEPLTSAVEAAKANFGPSARVILMSPRGKTFTQAEARRLHALGAPLIFICGRYEGVDERVMSLVDEELSVGDFVLTGGELPALCIVDAVARLVPGVLGNETSGHAESFEEGLLEYPQYTRPPSFRGADVPPVLQSGDHARIARWRRWKALKLTEERRPDLFQKLTLSAADQKLLSKREEDL
ncbi:MAG: tRNA (guanosine(37)-N1)-methyltransferase TrmD, partial [Myxococcaceae bacterium]